jgi:hypothetical protein
MPPQVRFAIPLADLGNTPEEAGKRLALLLADLRARAEAQDDDDTPE